MLIDDNDVDNYISQHILQKHNLAETIIAKTSAIDALEHLDSIKDAPDKFPDIIFLDIRMPVMDGFGFLENFMKYPDAVKNKCRIFMLTSSQDPKDIERATANPHVKKYFNKPLNDEALAGLN